MADIMQAARWAHAGERVRREDGPPGWEYFEDPNTTKFRAEGFDQIDDANLTTGDILADNWIIVPKRKRRGARKS
jgi:hypothetical protein